MLATLTNIGDFVKITQGEPLNYVTKLIGWSEDISGAGTLKREFRWGTTNLVRASWMDLTEDNLTKIILNPENDLFVDFRLTLVGGGPITINDIYVEYEQDPIAEDPFVGYRPPLLVSENGNISNLTKIENFTFKPYQVNPAVVLYKELSYTINKMFGHETQYARAVPMEIGKDFTLHEWTLYDVDPPCSLKLLVPNNEFPDSKINFNPFGIDFEIPFEVHIVKDYFEEVFGLGTAPQKRDIIYFPLMNRIFEVESSYLWKDIMQREVYWKVSLKKYAPKSNRYEPQDLREGLDEITWDSDERFAEEVADDELKKTKPQQYDTKIGSRFYDPIRENIDDNLVIAEIPFKNYNITLSESQYDLRSIFATKDNPIAVTYKAKVDFPGNSDNEISLFGWFRELKPALTLPQDTVRGNLTKAVLPDGNYTVSFVLPVNRAYENDQLIKVTRHNGFSIYGEYTGKTTVSGGYQYSMKVDKEIVEFLDEYYTGWYTSSANSGYIAEPTYEECLLNGYDEATGTGWKLSVYASRYVVFQSVDTQLFILQNNLLKDNWYGFAFNVSNLYQQMSFNLWIRQWSESEVAPPQTTNLENIYSKTVVSQILDRSADIQYSLPASNIAYTNIRLFSQAEPDLMKQMTVLNQNIVQDSHFSIIIDNAIQRLTLPFIGKTK